MYRKAVEIFNSPAHSVVSYGNGAAYSVQRHSDGATLWLQGDDALAFGEIFGQDRDYDDAIADYSEVFDAN